MSLTPIKGQGQVMIITPGIILLGLYSPERHVLHQGYTSPQPWSTHHKHSYMLSKCPHM